MPFRRSLSDQFIKRLNQEREHTESWWSKMVTSPSVFMAIRPNDVISAYVGGASLAKVAWRNGRIELEVHRKYLVFPAPPGPKASVRDRDYAAMLGLGQPKGRAI